MKNSKEVELRYMPVPMKVLGITSESITALGDTEGIDLTFGEKADQILSSGIVLNNSSSAITVKIWLTGATEGYAIIPLAAGKEIRIRNSRIYKVTCPDTTDNAGITPDVQVLFTSWLGGPTEPPDIEIK